MNRKSTNLTVLLILIVLALTVFGQDNYNTTLIGRWAYGSCSALATQGDTVFIASGGYFQIVDLTDLNNPVEVGTLMIPTTICDIAISGNYAYVVGSETGLRIIDIQNLTAPVETGHYDTEAKGLRLAVSGNYVYMTTDDGILHIIGVSDPLNPLEVGTYNGNYETYMWQGEVATSNNCAYLTIGIGSEFGLRIIDVSTPSNPQEVGSINPPDDSAIDVAVDGNYAYVLLGLDDTGGGIQIVDVSDPANPMETGYYDFWSGDSTMMPWADGPESFTVKGSFAYVAAGTTGVRIVDLTDPLAPTEIGRYQNHVFATGIGVSENYAYVIDKYSGGWGTGEGLTILDISDPENPTEAGIYSTGSSARDVEVSGSYAYVASDPDGLYIIDISTPSSPQEVGFFDTDYSTNDIAVSGSYAYVANSWQLDGGSLSIIDVSTPSSPQAVGSFNSQGDSYYVPYGVAVNGSYAYVTYGEYGLRIVDVSTPTSPQEVGFFDTDGYPYAVAVSGNLAYVADGSDGLYIIQNNLLVSTDEDPSLPESFQLQQNYPNPFNPTTTIQYSLPDAEQVKLTIFDIRGQEITTLVQSEKPPGTYEVQWKGMDRSGNHVSTGVYFARLQAGEYSKTIKMLYLK